MARWESIWALPAAPREEGKRRLPIDAVANAAFWPVALALIVHRVFVLAINGHYTDDFSTVHSALRRFLEGVPVYNENYSYVDPHYLYNPGATLLLSPLALGANITLDRFLFICLNALAIVAGLALLTRLFGFSLRSCVWPASIALAFLTESVRNTLIFANINGVLFLALAAFLWLLVRERLWAAGLVIGLAILVKPIFAPLLFLPLVKAQWPTILGGTAVPVAFNAVAWPIIPGASDYLSRTVPYLGIVRDYSNNSIRGMAIYFGFSPAATLSLLGLIALFVALGVIFLLRYRYADPVMWLSTTSSLLLTGVFLLSSLGQMYYSMLLFPLLFTVFSHVSAAHNPVTWLGAYLALTPDNWASNRWLDVMGWFQTFHATAGWALIVVGISVSSIVWYRAADAYRRPPLSPLPQLPGQP